MKILLINYHYFIYGGPDRYFFNIQEQLIERGHSVVPFCFNYDNNLYTEFKKYFPEVITGKSFLYNKKGMNLYRKSVGAIKLFYNADVENRFRSILEKERPDLIYSIYLSCTFLPKLLKIAKEEFEISVVYRLSDFHMYCPSYLFFRNGSVCTDCDDSLYSAIRFRCVHGSAVASALRVMQISVNRWTNHYKHVDKFVCPSQFMAKTLRKSFPVDKIRHIPTFSNDLYKNEIIDKSSYILFFGKVVKEKGIEVLLTAFNCIKRRIKLRVVGDLNIEYGNYLNSLIRPERKHLVSFEGHKSGGELNEIINGCKFAVFPAIWFENMPNTIIESMSAKKPIIASNIGSLTELIPDGKNGLLVSPGCHEELAAAMEGMLSHVDLQEYGRQSRRLFEERHTADRHMESLLGLFEELHDGRVEKR